MQTGKTLLDWLSSNKLPPLGCPEIWDWANTYGLFLGRFRIVGSSIHSSATCLVIFAFDLKQDTQNPTPVALKLMHNSEEYEREMEMRKLGDGSELDGAHVLQLLDSIELDENADEHDARLKGEDSFRFLHVMDRAQKDLSDALSHGRIAGRDRKQIVKIANQLVAHLPYLQSDHDFLHQPL